MEKDSAKRDGGAQVVLVYSTFPDRASAGDAARALVRDGHAACVNMLPGMQSVYVWEGAMEEAEEVVFIAKTTRDRSAAAMQAIRAAHPYDEPALMVLPVIDGSPSYLEWIVAATGGS